MPRLSAAPVQFRIGQPVMGTVLQVTVVDDDAQRARALAEAAIADVRRWDDVLTTWRAGGELARLNAAAGQGEVRISAALAAALRRMLALAAATGNAFDPAIGPFVAFWRQPGARPATNGRRPMTMAAVLRLDGTAALLAPGAELDAGGIGKGIALDAAAAGLRRAGVTSAFLDFGGSTQLAVGHPPREPQGWPVVLAGLDAGVIHGVIALRDAALSTSRATGPGSEAGPIVDPATGAPVQMRRLATVLAPSAADADAWSTALVVRGSAGIDAAQRAGLQAFVEERGSTRATRAFPVQVGRGRVG
jgi:thiamine biosynthesis lipoprotein